jgi:hypothetical protein
MAIMATVKFLLVLSKTGRIWTCPRDQTLSPRIHRWEAGSPCRWNPGAPGQDHDHLRKKKTRLMTGSWGWNDHQK